MSKGEITVVAIIALAIVGAAIVLGVFMYNQAAKATLVPYTGVGSGVYKHGTIVEVKGGRPIVIGHFDDDSGKTWPGTWEVKNK